jgi:hypothetical protein
MTFPIFKVRSIVPEYLPEKLTADNPGSGPRQLVQSRDPVIAAWSPTGGYHPMTIFAPSRFTYTESGGDKANLIVSMALCAHASMQNADIPRSTRKTTVPRRIRLTVPPFQSSAARAFTG